MKESPIDGANTNASYISMPVSIGGIRTNYTVDLLFDLTTNLVCKTNYWANAACEFRKLRNSNECFSKIPTTKTSKEENYFRYAVAFSTHQIDDSVVQRDPKSSYNHLHLCTYWRCNNISAPYRSQQTQNCQTHGNMMPYKSGLSDTSNFQVSFAWKNKAISHIMCR